MVVSSAKLFFSVASGVLSLTWILTNVELVPVELPLADDPKSYESHNERIGHNGNVDLLPMKMQQSDDPFSTDLKDKTLIYSDFNFESKMCGFLKCFFLSKQDDSFGYLLGPTRLYQESIKTFAFAKRMEEEDSIDQPLLTPPALVPLSQSMSLKIGTIKFKDQYFEPDEVVVSKVRAIKNEPVVSGCNIANGKTSEKLKKRLPQYIEKSPNPTIFLANFLRSMAATKKTIMKNTCLFLDMQVMVDNLGYVHHIDLDRCFQFGNKKVPEDQIEVCMNSLTYLEILAKDLAGKEEKRRNTSLR